MSIVVLRCKDRSGPFYVENWNGVIGLTATFFLWHTPSLFSFAPFQLVYHLIVHTEHLEMTSFSIIALRRGVKDTTTS